MRSDSGVASEGRVAGIPKFLSWGKYTMTLTNINSDWMSNALACVLYAGPVTSCMGLGQRIRICCVSNADMQEKYVTENFCFGYSRVVLKLKDNTNKILPLR